MKTATARYIDFKKVVLLTDVEYGAEPALAFAARLCGWYGSSLVIAHSCRHHTGHGPSPTPLLESAPSVQEDAELRLKEMVSRAGLTEFHPSIRVCDSEFEEFLLGLNDADYELVIVTTHGRTGLQKWLHGSTAQRVFIQSRCPVLIVRGEVPQSPAEELRFSRVLFGTDMAAGSVRALQYAVGIAADHDADLTVMYVEEEHPPGFSFDETMTRRKLQDWVQHSLVLTAPYDHTQFITTYGKPAEKLLELSSEWKSDLVVLGARTMEAGATAASHWIGGVSYELACSAKCPVLIAGNF